MALSNIFDEPRREITESLIGIGLVVAVVGSDYWLSSWIASDSKERWTAMVFLMVGLPIVAALLVGVLFVVPALGEEVCNAFARVGMDPRPTKRYR